MARVRIAASRLSWRPLSFSAIALDRLAPIFAVSPRKRMTLSPSIDGASCTIEKFWERNSAISFHFTIL
jgi:hypothetical protein